MPSPPAPPQSAPLATSTPATTPSSHPPPQPPPPAGSSSPDPGADPVPAPGPVPTAALVLAGGPATRMGYPKHLLKLPNGQPLYLYVADLVYQACPHLDCVYISLAEGSYLDENLRALLTANPVRPSQQQQHQPSRPPITTINADNTPADAAVIGLDPDRTRAQHGDDTGHGGSSGGNHAGPPPLEVIWDKKMPLLHPPPTRAQQRREEKKRGSRERPAEMKSHKNRSTSSSKRRSANRLSDGPLTAPTTPGIDDPGGGGGGTTTPHHYHETDVEQDGDIDALGGMPGTTTAGGSDGWPPSRHGNGPGGPIRGFLAAHEALPDATWLVIACDYPRLTVSAIQYLVEAYEPPVTCFRGARNKMEPLVSIWSPEALARLRQNSDPAGAPADTKPYSFSSSSSSSGAATAASPVATVGSKLTEMDLSGDGAEAGPAPPAPPTPTLGILGTIRQLHGKAVEVPPGGMDDIWMYNVNTPGNWDTALELYDE
ncbi:uncharacterized protein B0I36DRAFT_338660 [Microdochium trichocladiopsis]|uniref:MobA-like NTP transferase domain-containing protein n=1 Tax=Microdochium trichocladiopsis TaxID=1682393 RepID=A0A9P8XS42_9PEZI|nr:uncharacterized protein B0I36DRAFT_338660 [Microdochium trichocladiopsis]KAH7014392.1 hypothetical protein B0I36DRAFT_338660 [Microdochium trichocladiopsis]